MPGQTGAYQQFVTISRAPSPSPPPNSSVADPEVLPLTPRFSWHTIDGVTSYRFQAATDSGFSSRVHYTPTTRHWQMAPTAGASYYILQTATDPNFTLGLKTVNTDNSTCTPTESWAEGQYYWRVAIVDSGIPANKGPYNGAIVLVDSKPNKVFLPGLQH